MRLDTFIVADAVDAGGIDGKFYVLGGGLSRYEVPGIPFPMPLGVLIRLEITEGELKSPHQLLLTVRGPTGNPNIPPLQIETAPDQPIEPKLKGEQRFLQMGLTLPAQVVRLGLYHVELDVDGERLGSISLPVIKAEGERLAAFQPITVEPSPPVATTKRPPPPPKKAKRKK
jgi:hypothetical protein